jgi:hypothetical protein
VRLAVPIALELKVVAVDRHDKAAVELFGEHLDVACEERVRDVG